MECRETRQLAEAFVSDQLLVETTQAVIAHVERCPACRAEIEGLRRLRAATRSAFEGASDLEVRPEFAAALTLRLQADAARRPRAQVSRRRWLGIAASPLLIVGAGLGWREWSASRLSALLRAAAGDHQFCALTFKLTERPISLEESARRYGEIYRAFQSVEPSTTTLSGGPLRILERHSCVFDSRRFVHIVLRYKDEKLSLLVSDDVPPFGELPVGIMRTEATFFKMPVTEGFHIASFRGARHVAFIVSSLGDDDVQDVARAMAAPVSRALAGA